MHPIRISCRPFRRHQMGKPAARALHEDLQHTQHAQAILAPLLTTSGRSVCRRPTREHQPLYMVSSLRTLNTGRPSSGAPPQMQVVTGGIGLPGRPRTEGGARRGPVALVGNSSAHMERPIKLSASPNPYALRRGQLPSQHNASVVIPSEGPWRMFAGDPAEASPET
jgi:hypothetical protein